MAGMMKSASVALAALLLGAVSAADVSSPFVALSPEFNNIVGSSPQVQVVFNTTEKLFHEGATYHPPTKSMFLVTDALNLPDLNNNQTTAVLVHVTGLDNIATAEYELQNNSALVNPGGAARYLYQGADLILFATIGNMNISGGIFSIDPNNISDVRPFVTSYGTYRYNSPDDLTVLPDGSIYFTDPAYGYYNGFTPEPTLPNQIYRYDPTTNTTRVMADGFGRPNGITHSPDGSVIYIGDTGASVGNGTIDYEGPRSVYAYSMVNVTGQPFLTNRRVFAMPYVSAYDGLKTDTMGNVWGFAEGGLSVWNSGGTLLGEIELDGDPGDFGFGEAGEIYVMAGNFLYKILVDASVVGTGVFP